MRILSGNHICLTNDEQKDLLGNSCSHNDNGKIVYWV